MKKIEMLEMLSDKIATCTKCQELVCSRTQIVFGTGNPDAEVVFIGECPGENEDLQGLPFVGKAGQLLTNILAACDFKREDVYILNTLKCRTPRNRTPVKEEVINCSPFWKLQLKIINPKYIVCLGAIAANALLETETSISSLRGKVFNYNNIKVICTYHPSYILRCETEEERAGKRKLVWEDMQLLLKEMRCITT